MTNNDQQERYERFSRRAFLKAAGATTLSIAAATLVVPAAVAKAAAMSGLKESKQALELALASVDVTSTISELQAQGFDLSLERADYLWDEAAPALVGLQVKGDSKSDTKSSVFVIISADIVLNAITCVHRQSVSVDDAAQVAVSDSTIFPLTNEHLGQSAVLSESASVSNNYRLDVARSLKVIGEGRANTDESTMLPQPSSDSANSTAQIRPLQTQPQGIASGRPAGQVTTQCAPCSEIGSQSLGCYNENAGCGISICYRRRDPSTGITTTIYWCEYARVCNVCTYRYWGNCSNSSCQPYCCYNDQQSRTCYNVYVGGPGGGWSRCA